MLIQKMMKSNKGSALVLTLIILMLMALLGSSIMMVTLSEAKMSVNYEEYNGAYFSAEAGIEQIAMELDKRMGQLQKTAKAYADANGLGIEAIWLRKYKEFFVSNIKAEFGSNRYDDVSINQYLLGTDSYVGELREILHWGNDFQMHAYKDLNTESDDVNRIVLDNVCLDQSDEAHDNFYLLVDVIGTNNEFKKRLNVRLKINIDPPYDIISIPGTQGNGGSGDGSGGGSNGNPLTLEQMPAMLTKAVVAEKNILAAGSNVNINGDVLSFGTVPNDGLGNEALDVPWYRYGGIMAGLPDIATLGTTDGTDLDRDGNGSAKNKTNIENSNFLGIDTTRLGALPVGQTGYIGDINITGKAATMSYLHTLYGTSTNASDISINGSIYARSIRSEVNARASNLSLTGTSNVINSLLVDSNDSVVEINGDYKGFVSSSLDINGGTNNNDIYKDSSNVIINGDSNIYFKNNDPSKYGIYLAGSTYLKNLKDGDGNPYMTGIAALKSSRRVENAFYAYEDPGSNVPPYNYLYYGYTDGQSVPNTSPKAYGALFMMDKYSPPGQGILEFLQPRRALHFKKFWSEIMDWSTPAKGKHYINRKGIDEDDVDIYATYLNTDKIHILDTHGAKVTGVTGYSYGAIVANDKIYEQSYGGDFLGNIDTANKFIESIKSPCIREYRSQLGLFLTDGSSATSTMLNYVAPGKHIVGDYVDSSSSGKISGKANVYYDSGDAFITGTDGNWKFNGQPMASMQGIIYAGGNIYIDAGFNFKGSIISSQNIVFKNNPADPSKVTSTITYDSGIQAVIGQMLVSDTDIGAFFKLAQAVQGSGNGSGGGSGGSNGGTPGRMDITKIKMDNMMIIDWKETDL